MSDQLPQPETPYLLNAPLVSLDMKTLRARIWEVAGFDIGENDPLHAAQVIYVAAMEDQARLLDLQAERMNMVFSDNLEAFHSETQSIVLSIKDEINTEAVKERMAAMNEQISRADTLAASIRANARLFKVFTVVNCITLVGAIAILLFVFK